jgi:hypothetical protein
MHGRARDGRGAHIVSEYEFDMHLTLADPDEDPEIHLGRLLAEGCDDSLAGIGRRGQIGLMFGREAPTAREAVLSAIAAVRRAIPGATLEEVAPDLVGLTEAASLLGFSRQNMRQLVFDGESSPPSAVYSGRPSLWHLVDLLTWLRDVKRYPVPSELLELGEVTRQVNLFVDAASTLPDVQEEIRAALV